MTIEQLSSLYAKGLYSPVNYYYDLLVVLRRGADFDRAMGGVPARFLGQIKELAARSCQAARSEAASEDRTLERRIMLWGEPPEKQPRGPVPVALSTAQSSAERQAANSELAQAARRASAVLKLISSPVRLRIVVWLAESDDSDTKLVRALNRSPATYAHHLALLRQNGFVASKRGKRSKYRLTKKGKELADVAHAVLAFEDRSTKSR